MWLGGLCTDANDTDDADNYAQQTNHDYIGSFGRVPNEPKTRLQRKHGHRHIMLMNVSERFIA